jgi:hypothetical protein
LLSLAPSGEGTEGTSEYGNYTCTQFDAVEELDVEVGKRLSLPQAICAEEVDKICRCQVQMNVLEAE